jgi:hypothetical protein
MVGTGTSASHAILHTRQGRFKCRNRFKYQGEFVYWIMSIVFYAEEKGVIQMTADICLWSNSLALPGTIPCSVEPTTRKP